MVVLSCETKHTPTQPAPSFSTPSKEVYHVVQQFLAADTLPDGPKFYVAYLQQDSLAGDLSLYLMSEYNSNGEVKPLPLTTWRVDQKIVFVFTGLEAVTSGGDTTYRHVIRETQAANSGKIWSPPFRCWRVKIEDQKVTRIDKHVSYFDFYPFLRLAAPPPPPKRN
ncbi:hypothetical protein [Hymenobacter tenuis]